MDYPLIDVMVDLETLGSGANSVIVQIGAVTFDRYSGKIFDRFLINIDPESSVKKGFEIEPNTVLWWMQQPEEARKVVFNAEKIDVEMALHQLNGYFRGREHANVWSHATFDFVLLMHHYQKLGIKAPFHYRGARDIRTLADLAGFDYKTLKDKPRVGVKHTALEDCLFQIEYCVECFKSLRGKYE
jgi:hypothetical protein